MLPPPRQVAKFWAQPLACLLLQVSPFSVLGLEQLDISTLGFIASPEASMGIPKASAMLVVAVVAVFEGMPGVGLPGAMDVGRLVAELLSPKEKHVMPK